MDPAHLQPGYRLDRYELLCPLAYGGMASVWLARFGGRLGFERLVVVKMILPQFSQDPRFQEMFLDEARIASRIEHANVARILDVGEHAESHFIVMEWVDGDSLSKLLRAADQRKQRIPFGVSLRVCADAAAGLHAAHSLNDRDGHSLGVVHRDVSPQNILVSNSGSTVIIDFGVAKARDRVSQDTSAGQLKGKIRYMAPEQALGRSIDHRADVWALGAILYELATGSPPYDGPNEVATLHMLTSGTAPAPLPATVPAAVRAVIERALSYDAAARYTTALELNLALEAAMIEIGESTSLANVAHYTGQLVGERKASRRKAVDAAVAAAHARDAAGGAPDTGRKSPAPRIPGATSTGSFPSVSGPSGSGGAFVGSAAGSAVAGGSVPPGANRSVSNAPTPHAPHGDGGALGLGEIPSATSSATLGSAAMEYLPHSSSAPDSLGPARPRRRVGFVALGLCLVAGVVGAALIVSSATGKRPGPDNARTTADQRGNGPPEMPVDPSTMTAQARTTAGMPAASPTVSAQPIAATATGTETTTVTNTTASAVAHKVPAVPAAVPRPKPATAPSSTGKKDYGF